MKICSSQKHFTEKTARNVSKQTTPAHKSIEQKECVYSSAERNSFGEIRMCFVDSVVDSEVCQAGLECDGGGRGVF